MARRKQTRRKSRAAVRRRKYMVRRIVVLIIFLAVITGLTLLLIRVFSGDFAPGGTLEESPTPPVLPTFIPEPTPTPVPQLPEGLTVAPSSGETLAEAGFKTALMYNRDETDSFSREAPISFGKGSEYSAVRGYDLWRQQLPRFLYLWITNRREQNAHARVGQKHRRS